MRAVFLIVIAGLSSAHAEPCKKRPCFSTTDVYGDPADKSKAPQISHDNTVVTDAIVTWHDDEALAKIKASDDAILACYKKAVAKEPELTVFGVLELDVMANGSIAAARVRGTPPTIESCIATAARKLMLPATGLAELATVTHGFNLRPRKLKWKSVVVPAREGETSNAGESFGVGRIGAQGHGNGTGYGAPKNTTSAKKKATR